MLNTAVFPRSVEPVRIVVEMMVVDRYVVDSRSYVVFSARREEARKVEAYTPPTVR